MVDAKTEGKCTTEKNDPYSNIYRYPNTLNMSVEIQININRIFKLGPTALYLPTQCLFLNIDTNTIDTFITTEETDKN